MSERYGNYTRLGVYQRDVAKGLHPTIPIFEAEAHRLLETPGVGIDLGYASATLFRLLDRGIAAEKDGGFVRGPFWAEAAKYYRWGTLSDFALIQSGDVDAMDAAIVNAAEDFKK